jgi:hypothetical protein
VLHAALNREAAVYDGGIYEQRQISKTYGGAKAGDFT